MSKIETGRYSELLRRALGMKGAVEVAGELSPEVSPTWQIEGNDIEWQFLKQVRVVSAAGGQGRVPAVNFIGQLVNPVGSGIIATIQLVSVSVASPSAIAFRFDDVAAAALATVEQNGPRDTRWGIPGTSISPLVVSSTTGALPTAGFLMHSVRVLNDTETRFTVPFVMAPNSTLFFSNTSTNILTVFSLHWHERRLDALEDA